MLWPAVGVAVPVRASATHNASMSLRGRAFATLPMQVHKLFTWNIVSGSIPSSGASRSTPPQLVLYNAPLPNELRHHIN